MRRFTIAALIFPAATAATRSRVITVGRERILR